MADAFNFRDSYKPPTQEFIRNSLLHGLLLDDNRSGFLPIQTSAYSGSDMENMSRDQGRLVRKLIKVAYENKERIKAMPLFGRLALYIKKRIMNKISLNSTSIDLSAIIGLDMDDFIRELYILTLGRTPDAESLNSAKQVLHKGLPKEALIYMICTSDEFANRARVAHLKQYHKIYSRYHLRERLKPLPIIGRVLELVTLPSRINSLSSQIEALEARLSIDQEKLISKIDWSIDYIDRKIANADGKISDADDRKTAEIISAVDVANQNIIHANVKIDNTALLITEISNKNKPVVYGLPGGVTAVQTKEFIFGVPSEEWRLAVYLSSGGIFEPGTEKYFRSILKEGMQVLDIGANLGIYTLHALAAGCHVYSYEPTPRIYKILLDNIGINGFEPTGRANVYNLAVSDTEGEVEFNIFDASGHNSMFAESEDNKVIRVKTVSLDNHLKNLSRIDVVKIDVEGAEALVLQGMKEIIANNPDIKIIMEFAPSNLKRGGVEPEYLIKNIRAMDMDFQAIDENSGNVLDIADEELCKAYSINILLQRTHLKARARE